MEYLRFFSDYVPAIDKNLCSIRFLLRAVSDSSQVEEISLQEEMMLGACLIKKPMLMQSLGIVSV